MAVKNRYFEGSTEQIKEKASKNMSKNKTIQDLRAGSSFFPIWITARRQEPVWRASIDALTPSRPSKVWVM